MRGSESLEHGIHAPVARQRGKIELSREMARKLDEEREELEAETARKIDETARKIEREALEALLARKIIENKREALQADTASQWDKGRKALEADEMALLAAHRDTLGATMGTRRKRRPGSTLDRFRQIQGRSFYVPCEHATRGPPED